jgi:gluconate 2-dehydrogenase gamma chain
LNWSGRRALLTSVATALLLPRALTAATVRNALPWTANAGDPPTRVMPGSWVFFTPEEGAAVEALVDRLIPADADTPGGKDAGCAVFIDRQLAGPFGSSQGLYMRPPFFEGTPQQGLQSNTTPAQRYRQSLAALGRLEDVSGRAFFELLLQNTKEGFFADPIYGGNRNMVGWRMIGFPGARYDYRDWVERHNERYPLPPVGIVGRPEWALPG